MERHRFDAVSFVFGALFAVVAVVALTDLALIRPMDLRWIAPGVLVLLGLVLVLTSGRGRNGGTDGPEPEQDEPAATVGTSAPAADDTEPTARDDPGQQA